jgi:hypothetical protein
MSDRTRHENYPSGLLHPAQAAAMPRTNRIAVKESMLSTVDRCVIAREGNVVRVNFSRDPDPPAPCFPGASGLRWSGAQAPHDAARPFAPRATV